MKYKKCEILLISESLVELKYWIEQYNNSIFENVENTPIRECSFLMDDGKVDDFRSVISFNSKASKNNIYKISNSIKANPIKFI